MYQNFIAFKGEYHTNVCTFHILFIHLPVDGHWERLGAGGEGDDRE